MAATADRTTIDTSTGFATGMAFYGHALSRALPTFIGGVLCVAAVGLWLVPGPQWDAALMLIKLGFSVFLALGGFMFLMSARQIVIPEVSLNPGVGRLMLTERDRFGTLIRETGFSYDDLSEVDFRDGMFIVRDAHGQALIEMPLDDTVDLDGIRAALGPAFRRSA